MSTAPAVVLYAPSEPGGFPTLLLAHTTAHAAETVAREESRAGSVIDVYVVTFYPGAADLPDWVLHSRWIGGNMVQHTPPPQHTPPRY